MKKWQLWLMGIFALLIIYAAITGVNRAKEDIKAGNNNAPTQKEEADKVEPEEKPKTEDERNIIEHGETFAFGEITVEDIRTEIIDNELTFKFNWINQSGVDKAPFTALGYIDVSQGDEVLAVKSDNPQTHDRNASGGILPVTLKYDLVNDESIRILFGATSEYDDTKEELIIEID